MSLQSHFATWYGTPFTSRGFRTPQVQHPHAVEWTVGSAGLKGGEDRRHDTQDAKDIELPGTTCILMVGRRNAHTFSIISNIKSEKRKRFCQSLHQADSRVGRQSCWPISPPEPRFADNSPNASLSQPTHRVRGAGKGR